MISEFNGKGIRGLLKIDVQGFELSVLKGETLLEQQGFRFQFRHDETVVDGRLIQADYLFAPIRVQFSMITGNFGSKSTIRKHLLYRRDNV